MTRSRRRSASEGAELVERYTASGLTQREFAAGGGMKLRFESLPSPSYLARVAAAFAEISGC